MAVFVTPPDQFVYVSSYFQKLFTFGSADDNLRICRYVNHFLDLFGQDVVLVGGGVTSYSVVDDVITITLSSGKLIQDKTLIPFNSFTLDKDITGYVGVGAFVVIYTSFQFNDSDRDAVSDPNTFFFKIGIVDSTGDLIGATWDNDINRILMCAYDIDNDIFLLGLTIEGTYRYVFGLDGSYTYLGLDPVDGGQL